MPNNQLPHDTEIERIALSKLSPTERRVFDLWIHGAGTSQMAKTLRMRQQGITGYRRKILNKLALKTTVDVVLFAVRQGLINPNLADASALDGK